MNDPIETSIAINADEPEQLSCAEIFSKLRAEDEVIIDGEVISLFMITDAIDVEDLREAAQDSLVGNGCAIYNLYINTIEEYLS